METSLKSIEKERGELYQRVAATQDTLAAQNKELQAKEHRSGFENYCLSVGTVISKLKISY